MTDITPLMLDLDQIVETVEQVVAERPDHVYVRPGETCVYVHNGEPSCLVGHALVRLGVPVDALHRIGDSSYDGGAGLGASMALEALVDAGEVAFPDARRLYLAQDYLARVQDAQDDGEQWSVALERGREYLRGQEDA